MAAHRPDLDRATLETIRSADGATGLAVAPAIGGGIAAYWSESGSRRIDWLRPTDPAALANHDPLGLSCFPLVPYSNRIRDGRFTHGGRAIQLAGDPAREPHAEHGHGWKAAWTVDRRAANFLSITYRHQADDWPFSYSARQEFRLDGRDLSVTVALTNDGHAVMPCGIGLHPYFSRSPACRLTASAPRMWRTDEEVLPLELIDPPAEARLDRGLAVADVPLDTAYAGWSGTAVIEWPEWRASLTMRAEGPLGHLVVYTPPGESYFCAEPVSNCTDAFNLAAQGRGDTGLIELPAGRSVQAKVRFSPEL
jgi:aldose 1-epimerase